MKCEYTVVRPHYAQPLRDFRYLDTGPSCSVTERSDRLYSMSSALRHRATNNSCKYSIILALHFDNGSVAGHCSSTLSSSILLHQVQQVFQTSEIPWRTRGKFCGHETCIQLPCLLLPRPTSSLQPLSTAVQLASVELYLTLDERETFQFLPVPIG